MILRGGCVALTTAVVLSQAIGAQATRAPQATLVLVRGVAYDSLRDEPLAGAVVTIVGGTRSTRADSRGRFNFDSVAPGAYTFAAQHGALDSIGFSAVSAHATVTDGRDEVRIAVPSFSTLWRVACGNAQAPTDSGFVYGTVRDAMTQSLLPNAVVDLTWLDLSVTKANGVVQTRWRGLARTDSTGSYGICGVPMSVGLRILATTESGASGLVDLLGAGLRVQRRDLVVGPDRDSVVAARGVITGIVIDTGGRPLADARVIIDGVPELRSGADGRFVVRNAPTGTRQVEVLSIGMAPVVAIVDVFPNDTGRVIATMKKLTTLDVIRVTASPAVRRFVREFDERRKAGFGYVRDSTDIANRGTLSSVFSEFPSTRVESSGVSTAFVVSMPSSRGGRCLANLFIDGVKADFEQLQFYRPNDIAAVEVYPHLFSVPPRFLRENECGAIIVWTKWSLG
jgi:hypothetical protein